MPAPGPRILVVDDSEDDVLLASAYLRRALPGAKCERVDTAEMLDAALAGARWDAVVCEESLPRLDFQLVSAILQEARVTAPFIVFTARRGPARAGDAQRAGAVALIDKSEPQRLAAVISEELAKRAPAELAPPPVVPNERAEVAAADLVLLAHPVIAPQGWRPWGVEVVARRHDERTGMSPADSEAPVTGCDDATVGEWLMTQAISLAIGLRAHDRRDLRVAVNVPRSLLFDTRLAERVAMRLTSCGASADSLELEVPEAWVLSNPRRAAQLTLELRRVGLRLALDDFGSTYGALAPLQALEPDTLKLAPGLVREARGPGREAALEGAIALARVLGSSVVAGGVDTRVEAAHLRELGVDRVQGGVMPPARVSDIPDLMARLPEVAIEFAPERKLRRALRP